MRATLEICTPLYVGNYRRCATLALCKYTGCKYLDGVDRTALNALENRVVGFGE